MNEKDKALSLQSADKPSLPPALDEEDSLVLDLSSLDADDTPSPALQEPSITASGEQLYHEVLKLMDEGELELHDGIKLLNKAAEGYTPAWLYLGELYSDPENSLYNPVIAFGHYQKAALAEDGEGYYRLGLCYHNGFGCEQDDHAAVDALLKGAAAGHTESICALGICREYGIGCDINYEMAVGLYSRASREGSATATNNLGGCYFYGHGVPRDKERAIELYQKAAEMGNSNAECRLGVLSEEGDSCDKDTALAFIHYKNAAHAGNPIALYRLARCYDMGIGTEQNYTEAYRLYEEAGNLDNAEAMYEAGMMSLHGKGTKKDPSAAYKLLSHAADAGIASAEYEIGNCLFDGIGTVRNREAAFNRYLRAYEIAHDPRAIFKLGLCKLKGFGTEKDPKAAYEWFCKGASRSSRGATYMQGECLYYGIGVAEDKNAAALCFNRAISYEYTEGERLIPALLAMGKCLDEGEGLACDREEALSLYRRAAELSDTEALYLAGRTLLDIGQSRADYAVARDYILRAARKNYLPAMLLMGILADEGRFSVKRPEDALHWYLASVNTEVEDIMPIFEFPNRFAEHKKQAKHAKIEAQYRLGILSARLYQTPKDYIHAYENIALSAAMGFIPAQNEVAKIYASGGDLEKYYSKVFSHKNRLSKNEVDEPDQKTVATALGKLGDTFFDGRILKKNAVAAAKCYRQAAELGNNDAAYSYGWCLRHGEGVRENDTEAAKWLKLSADRGNINAAYSYGLCCEEGSDTGVKNRREALTYYRKAAAAGHQNAAKRYVMLSENEE